MKLDKNSNYANEFISLKENKLGLWCFKAPDLFCDR